MTSRPRWVAESGPHALGSGRFPLEDSRARKRPPRSLNVSGRKDRAARRAGMAGDAPSAPYTTGQRANLPFEHRPSGRADMKVRTPRACFSGQKPANTRHCVRRREGTARNLSSSTIRLPSPDPTMTSSEGARALAFAHRHQVFLSELPDRLAETVAHGVFRPVAFRTAGRRFFRSTLRRRRCRRSERNSPRISPFRPERPLSPLPKARPPNSRP